MLKQLWLIVPESRFRGPACSGVSTNVFCGQSFMSIATRCFAALGPAAATDVSVTAAASATRATTRAFMRSPLRRTGLLIRTPSR